MFNVTIIVDSHIISVDYCWQCNEEMKYYTILDVGAEFKQVFN